MTSLSGKRILIAGGTGTVGRYLVRAALEAGAAVIVPTRRTDESGAPEPGLLYIEGDITDEGDGDRIISEAGRIDGAIVSIGRWIHAEHVLDAPLADFERAIANYPLAHFAVAKVLLPAVEATGGGYVSINGSLAYEIDGPGTGLVGIAGATQSMLYRTLMHERRGKGARINELVIYSAFGRGNDDANEVKGEDVGRYACYLLSDRGRDVKSQAIHLRTREDLVR
jgi:NAD(P)-dependent dehydrogenase (short-subunit alcohol dehydrogenase family)